MDVACPKCGASNRNTSRFCARCGEPLPQQAENGQPQAGGELNLPWLQAVHERAVQQTGHIDSQDIATEDRADTGTEEAAQTAVDEPEAPAAEVVDQAAAPGESTAPPEAPADAESAESAAADADEPPPGWVVGILEPGAEPSDRSDTGADQTYEPEEMEHIMPWLGEGPPQGVDAPEGASERGEAGLPPWLGDVTVQETLETQPPAEQSAAADLGPEIEGLEPFVPPEVEEQRKVFEPPPDPTPATPTPARPKEKVPEWLKSLAPAEPEVEKEPGLERTTPVTKVILAPSDTLAEPVVRAVPVRPPRSGAVETLAALMQAPAGDALRHVAPGAAGAAGAAREVAPGRGGLVRWLMPDGIIYLIVLAALVTVLMIRPPFGRVDAPPAPDVMEFYGAIEAAPSARPVLVVYDWDASRSAEMSALANAVTHHLMSRRLRFVTISTVPQGPGFAREITLAAAQDPQAGYGYEYGRDYLVLGYLPGSEAALGGLVSNFDQMLPLDYVNSRSAASYPVVQGSGIGSLQDFGLIVNLASDEVALRNWVEQVATRTQVPIVAAVPQGLEPVARPYKGIAGPGLKAVVSGQAGAIQYVQQLASRGPSTTPQFSREALETRLNTQSVAQLLVALAIVGAFVSLGTRRVFRRSS
jgi:hypothetical protein